MTLLEYEKCPQCGETQKAIGSPFLEEEGEVFVWEHWCFSCYAVWCLKLAPVSVCDRCPQCGDEFELRSAVLDLCTDEQGEWVFKAVEVCLSCEQGVESAYRPIAFSVIHEGGHGSPLYREVNGEAANG